MKKELHIYNHYHYGDIFYSRSIIKLLSNKFKITYYHNLKYGLFKDLDFINEVPQIPMEYPQNLGIHDNKINSWLGAHGVSHSCSYYSNLEILKKISIEFGISMENNESYLPEINYKNLSGREPIFSKMSDFKKKFKKIILISTGNVHSGQSTNFDFEPIIEELSLEFNDCLFLTTTKNSKNIHNIIFTGEITNLTLDLLEISFISTFCDLIIGRASGPFCYTHTKENLFDKTKTFISFSNLELEGKFFLEGDSKKIWSDDYSFTGIYNTIKNQIQ